jgi:hypothetical protein
MIKRVLLAIGVGASDLVVLFIPLRAVFPAYKQFYNLPLFRELLSNYDAGQTEEMETKYQEGGYRLWNVTEKRT